MPALVFAAVIVIFVVQNLHKAKISFLTFSGSFPLALALLVAAAPARWSSSSWDQ